MSTASRAIDGNLDQHWLGGSVTHTDGDDYNPWWELSLVKAQIVQHVRIFNRNDCCGSRLSNAILELYNDEGERVYRQNLGAAEDIKEVRLGESYNVKRVKIQVSISLEVRCRQIRDLFYSPSSRFTCSCLVTWYFHWPKFNSLDLRNFVKSLTTLQSLCQFSMVLVLVLVLVHKMMSLAIQRWPLQ